MKSDATPNSIVLHAYPQFVFAWPVIVFGFFFAAIQSAGWVGEAGQSAIAWIYITILCLVMLAMGVDLGRNSSIFCLVLFVGGLFGILWLQSAYNVTFFHRIGKFLDDLNPHISSAAMVATSIVLSLIYGMMLIMAMVNDRWRITHNEIEHRMFGHKDDATGRGAKRVMARYPDVLELLICCSGTIEVFSSLGTQQLATIKNVPFLPFRMKKIGRILETTSVEGANAEEEEHEEAGPPIS